MDPSLAGSSPGTAWRVCCGGQSRRSHSLLRSSAQRLLSPGGISSCSFASRKCPQHGATLVHFAFGLSLGPGLLTPRSDFQWGWIGWSLNSNLNLNRCISERHYLADFLVSSAGIPWRIRDPGTIGSNWKTRSGWGFLSVRVERARKESIRRRRALVSPVPPSSRLRKSVSGRCFVFATIAGIPAFFHGSDIRAQWLGSISESPGGPTRMTPGRRSYFWGWRGFQEKELERPPIGSSTPFSQRLDRFSLWRFSTSLLFCSACLLLSSSAFSPFFPPRAIPAVSSSPPQPTFTPGWRSSPDCSGFDRHLFFLPRPFPWRLIASTWTPSSWILHFSPTSWLLVLPWVSYSCLGPCWISKLSPRNRGSLETPISWRSF